MRYAISSSVKALFALRSKLEGRLARLRGEKYSNLAQQQVSVFQAGISIARAERSKTTDPCDESASTRS